MHRFDAGQVQVPLPSKALAFAARYIDVGPVPRGGRAEQREKRSAAVDPRRESDRIGLAVSARCAYSALTTLRLAPRYLILTCSSFDSELPGRCREQDEEEEGEGRRERGWKSPPPALERLIKKLSLSLSLSLSLYMCVYVEKVGPVDSQPRYMRPIVDITHG